MRQWHGSVKAGSQEQLLGDLQQGLGADLREVTEQSLEDVGWGTASLGLLSDSQGQGRLAGMVRTGGTWDVLRGRGRP